DRQPTLSDVEAVEPGGRMKLTSLRSSQTAGMTFDASRPLFRVGLASAVNTEKVSELIQALPWLKADPVIGVEPTAAGGAFAMRVTVQRTTGTLTVATYYDNRPASTIP